jgi:hypothetical protein
MMSWVLALLPGAIAARLKEPKPNGTVALLALKERNAELKEKLRLCEAARDAARADRDQSDAQLRMVLRRFAEEQAARLQLQRDLIEAQAFQRAEREVLGPLLAQSVMLPLPARAMLPLPAPTIVPLTQSLENAMRQMDEFICNCAPGRHEILNLNRLFEE